MLVMIKKLMNSKRGQWLERHGVCCVTLSLIALALLQGCTLDTESIARKRANLEFLCADPKTVQLKELCDRVVPGATGPVDLLAPE